jgi:hypothetical protein
MAEGASSDDHRGGMMHGGGGCSLLQGTEPVLTAPLGGVGGIHGEYPQPLVSAHLHQPVAKPSCWYAAHDASHTLAALSASESLASYGSNVLEVEMLDREHAAILGASKGNEFGDRGSQPSISRGRVQAVEFERDGARLTNRIASWVHNPTCKVSSVQINRDDP